MTSAKATIKEILRWMHTYGSEVSDDLWTSAVHALTAAGCIDQKPFDQCAVLRRDVAAALYVFEAKCAAYVNRGA